MTEEGDPLLPPDCSLLSVALCTPALRLATELLLENLPLGGGLLLLRRGQSCYVITFCQPPKRAASLRT